MQFNEAPKRGSSRLFETAQRMLRDETLQDRLAHRGDDVIFLTCRDGSTVASLSMFNCSYDPLQPAVRVMVATVGDRSHTMLLDRVPSEAIGSYIAQRYTELAHVMHTEWPKQLKAEALVEAAQEASRDEGGGQG